MRCPKCNNDMTIVNEFTEAAQENGTLTAYSVVDLLCTDPKCPDGVRGLPTARLRRRIENRSAVENAVSCCGTPLAYTSATGYHIPDESVVEETLDDRIMLLCKLCGARHELMTTGRERV